MEYGGENPVATFAHALLRVFVLSCVALTLTLGSQSAAEAETRTLKLYYIHTKERAEITYKKNGRYLKSGLDKLNRFLRDWRRNEPTRMDPELFDILWEAYRMSGARDYIHVVSAYRSPATNEMLRRTRGGQAKKSQHMLGKAMDFYIPGVKLSKLREVGFKLQGGGVGYYPKSGSPFVHFDTGNVRAWPRMSRPELARIFPKGGTLHLPPDGKPLPGYQQALASYQSRKRSGQATAIVSTEPASRSSDSKDNKKGQTLLAAIFGGGADEEEDNVESAAPVTRPTRTVRSEPEPPQETPGTMIAALSARETPRPVFAPRPQALVPVTTEQPPVLAAAPPVEQPLPAPQLASVPLPAPKPQVLVANADPLPNRRTAEEIETALNAANTETALQRASVEKLIAAASPEPVQTAAAAFRIPLPVAAPRAAPAASQPVAVASLPVPMSRADVAPIAVAYAPQFSPERLAVEPMSPPAAPAARPADAPRSGRLVQPDARVAASYESGVVTTGKSPRPLLQTASVAQKSTPKPVVIPAEEVDPARFGSWTTARLSITDDGRPSDRPMFVQNALREAPTEVYTDGFRRDPAPDSRRFSGNAVTFLAVAKFEGGKGGDGQPLTLQIPVAN
jgi:uncharacterized protein YcbK (DUF882 family)